MVFPGSTRDPGSRTLSRNPVRTLTREAIRTLTVDPNVQNYKHSRTHSEPVSMTYGQEKIPWKRNCEYSSYLVVIIVTVVVVVVFVLVLVLVLARVVLVLVVVFILQVTGFCCYLFFNHNNK